MFRKTSCLFLLPVTEGSSQTWWMGSVFQGFTMLAKDQQFCVDLFNFFSFISYLDNQLNIRTHSLESSYTNSICFSALSANDRLCFGCTVSNMTQRKVGKTHSADSHSTGQNLIWTNFQEPKWSLNLKMGLSRSSTVKVRTHLTAEVVLKPWDCSIYIY